jgi:uncharacterized membrane protein YgcG
MRKIRRAVAASAALALSLAAAPAAARELHWRSIDVRARLEPDGALRVVETQAMVFTGDWNGGERKFRLRFGQRYELVRISRIDPASGAEVELTEGDLDRVDEYAWHDSKTLRWRSRRPSDPPFAGQELVYRIEGVYSGILKEAGDRLWVLDHDLLFADRDGDIERARLELDLGADWELAAPAPAVIEVGRIPPGEGLVARRELRFTGAGRPARAGIEWPDPSRAILAAAFLLLLALERLVAWLRRDAALGRFAPGPERIDRAWLEQRVLSMPPEVVGAAWDRSVAGPEVAATLARLIAERKLSSRVERRGWSVFGRDVLHLRLEVPIDEIDSTARPLIQALFPLGAEIDTDRLREHYRSRGFQPASKLRVGLEKKVAALRGFEAGSPKPSWKPTLLLIATGLALAGVAAATAPGGFVALVAAGFLVPASLPGWIGAAFGQARIGVPVGSLIAIVVSLLLHVLIVGGVALAPGLPWLAAAAAAVVAAGYGRAFFNLLMTRESAASLAVRRELAAARRYFEVELARRSPDLEDRWFPWIVAFGLAPQVDRWFRAHGASGGLASSAGTTSFGHGSSSSAGGGWSGGGGSFGGAGATASFAAAVSTMAAGVSAPSSSGGGGGGGGGGSSGGGGGGGW